MTASSVVGGAAGLISMACVVFYGGALAERVAGHERRLVLIEGLGSPTVQRHIDEDNTRVSEIRRRLDAQDAVLADLLKLKSEVAAINTKIDFLIERQRAAK